MGVGSDAAARRARARRAQWLQDQERAPADTDRRAGRPLHRAGGRGRRPHRRHRRLAPLVGRRDGGARRGPLRHHVAAGLRPRHVRQLRARGRPRGRRAPLLRLVQPRLPPGVPRAEDCCGPRRRLAVLQLQAGTLLGVPGVRHAGRDQRNARVVRHQLGGRGRLPPLRLLPHRVPACRAPASAAGCARCRGSRGEGGAREGGEGEEGVGGPIDGGGRRR
mmetsp:Transcript_10605/g.33622  ORF Transcript_10605/g.33622 Transcript_10605/m.33622 type:complete len:220 (-) Transcript_10605:185-844(-)